MNQDEENLKKATDEVERIYEEANAKIDILIKEKDILLKEKDAIIKNLTRELELKKIEEMKRAMYEPTIINNNE